MTLQIVFGVDDLARVKIGQLDPLIEVSGAAHRSLSRPTPPLRTWAKDTGERLSAAGPMELRDLRSALVQISNFGVAGTSESTQFEDALEAALSQPARRWEAVLGELSIYGLSPPAASLQRLLLRLEHSASQYYEAAVARHWNAMIAEAEVTTARWATTLRRQGIGAMLDILHPGITWQPSVLSVLTISQAGHCLPGCPHHISRSTVEGAIGGPDLLARVSSHGLAIVPSIFSSACNVDGNVNPGPRLVVNTLIVPIPIHPGLFDIAESNRSGQHLDQLLGMSRACVLLACSDQELTTSQLAHTVGISISSASEHAAILRSKGLLSSRRQRNTVIHSATGLGLSLVRGRANEDETRRIRLLGPD